MDDPSAGSGQEAPDTSGNGNTGTITGATYKSGKIGKALNFNGGTDTVTVSNSLSTKSVEFWVYPTTTTQNLIDLRTAATAANISVSGGAISATGFTSPTIYVNGIVSSTLSASVWQHVTITTGTAITANAIQFGRISTTSLTGKLDSIRIFDYVRSAAQIAWDYNRGGPVGWWKMDECQGITANDSSGNGNSGTITIGATGTNTSAGTCTGSAGEAWKDGATGKYNSSLEFDGTDDYINIGSPASLSMTGPVTQSAWIKLNSIAVQKVIIGAETQYNLQVSRNSTGDISVVDGAGHGCITNGNAISSTSNWYHIVGIFSGTTTQTVTTSNCLIYVNGILQTSSVLGTPWSPSTLSSFNIGNWANTAGTTYKVNGQIDDVKIFNYALTANQVKNLYNQGSAIQFAPTMGSP